MKGAEQQKITSAPPHHKTAAGYFVYSYSTNTTLCSKQFEKMAISVFESCISINKS